MVATMTPKSLHFTGKSSSGKNLEAWYLENGSVGCALVSAEKTLPRIVHWGKPLSHPETALNLYDALHPERVSGGLDDTVFLSILPMQDDSWTGASRFVVRRDGVELFCSFIITNVVIDSAGEFLEPLSDVAQRLVNSAKTSGNSVETYAPAAQAEREIVSRETFTIPHIVVKAEDAEQGVHLTWEMQILESGLLRQKATVMNLGKQSGQNVDDNSVLSVQTLELGYPLPPIASEVLTTTGHHLREHSPQRQPLTMGRFARTSMVGRPDFDASLLMSVGQTGFGFESGEVWSVHVAWSGNSILAVDRTTYALPVLGGGEVIYAGEADCARGESYTTPWVYGSYGVGINQVVQRFHASIRAMHPSLQTKPRPVILNTWEAVYFNHSFDTLKELADNAANCGVERFVVDDGWFGSRRDDTSGLGDWQVSPAVWPNGLKPLADYVHSLNMEFGLWFEPEMVNLDSDVVRAHPEWVLSPTDNRLPMQGRSQQVIDLTNPEALDYIFGCMDSLVDEIGIDYIKWDHNKLVIEPKSRKSGLPAVHEQTVALYAIFDALKLRHPGLEIETCSSGGGRIDMGILSHADRLWTSDCVDPVERVEIQRYTSLLAPPEMMGEHVGASPAHSTGRATSLPMRAATAFFGHLGIEWNLNIVSDEDKAELAQWVNAYKENRDIVARGGKVVHADSPDAAVRVSGVVSADGTCANYRFAQVTTSQNYPPLPIHLPGLDPEETYIVKPLSVSEDKSAYANGQSPLLWWNEEGVEVTGESLVNFGIRPPQLNPAQAVIINVQKA